MAIEAPCSRLASVAMALTRFSLCYALLATSALPAQQSNTQEPVKLVPAPSFFESQNPIEVTLTANIGKLRGDKDVDPPWRTATLSYKGPDGSDVTVPLRARTRGIWRLKTCEFPPLRLNFTSETSKGSIFNKLDKPKLVRWIRAVHPSGVPALPHLSPAHAGESQRASAEADLRRQRQRKSARETIWIRPRGAKGHGCATRRKDSRPERRGRQ